MIALMSMGDTPSTLAFTRRKLPHWLVADHTYFVTIRLADTIPRSVLNDMAAERDALTEANASKESQQQLQREHFLRIEKILDQHQGDRDWLLKPDIAANILDALPWLEHPSRGWELYAVTLMSTHVHIVMRNKVGRSGELLRDLGQFKRHTARTSNRFLGRTGSFWAREDFDHWCRSEEKVISAIRYTANNPVAARLCCSWRDWPWTHVNESWIEITGL